MFNALKHKIHFHTFAVKNKIKVGTKQLQVAAKKLFCFLSKVRLGNVFSLGNSKVLKKKKEFYYIK